MQVKRLIIFAAAVVAAGQGGAKAAAFPGAVGFGKDAVGGRSTSTTIHFVTNLKDYDENETPIDGSLRKALEASGPRFVIFKTGGVIRLTRTINVSNGTVTVAGQTAPGGGIAIRNNPIRWRANNIIVRGLRQRPGDQGPGLPAPSQLDAVQIGGSNFQAQNMVFDHCSFGWSKDEIAEFWFGVKNVTLSNCTFAEALWFTDNVDADDPLSHGYGPLIGGTTFLNERITFYRNLFAHNQRRNPWIQAGATVEMVNNVIYNWDSEAIGIWGSAAPNFVNLIGNYTKAGPETNTGSRGIQIRDNAAGTQIYLSGNIGPNRANDTLDQWAGVGLTGAAATYRTNTIIAAASSGIPLIETAANAFNSVMTNVGAIPRDAHDARVVAHARAGNGKHLDSLTQVPGPKQSGYPVYSGGVAPKDSDNDGMPDSWEIANGLNPNHPADAKVMRSGYLNLEHYINSFFPSPAP